MKKPRPYIFGQCPTSAGENQVWLTIELCDDAVEVQSTFSSTLSARSARAAGKRLVAMADYLEKRKENKP